MSFWKLSEICDSLWLYSRSAVTIGKAIEWAADIFPDISLILNLISICPARAYFRKIKCPGIGHFVKSALFEKKNSLFGEQFDPIISF